MTEQTLIIGAGPAGLGAALALGEQAVVLEAGPDTGGLCRTITLDGAVFDLGGHSFHTPHPNIRELVFQSLAMEEQKRQAFCYFRGQQIPFPFQKHFEQVHDGSIREACRNGLAAAGDKRPVTNFDEYLNSRFGEGISRHFLRPYNQKLWGKDLGRLAVDWTPERVPAPAGTSERFLSQGGKRTPLQDGTTVAYPAKGGFGKIFRALAKRIANLHFSKRVVRIDPAKREVSTADGSVFSWHQLISTLPIPRLLDLLPSVPAWITRAVRDLEILPMSLVLVVGNGRLDTPIQRFYCADPEIPAHKIVLNHNSSSYLRGLPRHGIMAEIAGPRKETGQQLIQQVIDGLRTLGLTSFADNVRQARIIRLEFGYPVPTHSRSEIVGGVKYWLSARGIQTLGRFGEWAYINSDEALHRGHNLGHRLLQRAAA